MSEFIITPTNIEFIESIFRNPDTGRWVIPVLTFDLQYPAVYFPRDPLNEDPNYQKSVVNQFYLRLKEKWLYHDVAFRKLLKYFQIEKSNGKITVQLIDDPDKVGTTHVGEDERNYVFRYIEKYFVTKKFVDQVIRSYVNTARVKWYDLFYNTDILKDLLAHKLKRLILSTVYELHDRITKKI